VVANLRMNSEKELAHHLKISGKGKDRKFSKGARDGRGFSEEELLNEVWESEV